MTSFDLNAVAAEAAGKRRAPFTFHWGEGDDREDFTVEVTGDLRWALALQGKDLYKTLVRLLGKEDFERLDAVDKPFTEVEAAALIEAFTKHVGADSGKASPRSKRSKITVVR